MKKLNALTVFLTLEGTGSLLFALAFNVSMLYQVTTAQLNPLQLVLVGTTLEASIFLFEVPTGVVADVYSRRLSVILGYVLIGLGFLVWGALPLFLPILLGQVLWGIGYTFTSGATQAWITDEIGEAAAGPAFLRGRQFANLGALLGIPLSVLLGLAKVNVPILLSGACFILLALFLALVMPESGFQRKPPLERDSWRSMIATFRNGLGMLRRRPVLLTIMGVGLFYGLYSEGYDRLWLKHILDGIGLPQALALQPVVWVGIINIVGLLLSTGATEILRRRLDTQSGANIARVMLVTSAILVTSLIGFGLTSSFVPALLLIWIIAIVRSLNDPLYTTWVNQRLDSSVRATVLSMSSQMDAIGQIITGPFVGLVGKFVSVQAALSLTGIILSPVLWLIRRAIHQETNTPEASLVEETI